MEWSLPHIDHYSCVACDAHFGAPGKGWCEHCGPTGTLTIHYDWDYVRSTISKESLKNNPDPRVERYAPLLPFPAKATFAPLPVWRTPLVSGERIEWKGGPLWIKDDSRLPSSSLKDRATFVAVSRALTYGTKGIVCASTGNAASSLAAFCAASGIPATILVPASAPRPKLAQVMISGAKVIPVEGTYDDAFDLSLKVAEALDCDLRSTGVNPYLAEGKKTCALEIAEQFDWNPPEFVAVSVGDGCIISGLAKGFQDLHDLGWIERVPKLIGVQAVGSSSLARAFARGLTQPEVVEANTIADSISVNLPRDGVKALRSVRASGGRFVTVTDEEILAAMRTLASRMGVFAEPAGATAVAGLIKLAKQDSIQKNERSVAVVTGNMLKDTASALKAIGELAKPVEANIDTILKLLAQS
ncbi:MAG: threonine synthase [Planctomycetota bacterium]|nr:threonine synthase [Planctomycetota bacterium]